MDAFAMYRKDVEYREGEGKTQNETVEEQTSSAISCRSKSRALSLEQD